MTTANLSVGIDTSKAKADLLALRKDMEGQPHTLLLNVDTTALNKEVKGWIDRKKFQVILGADNLGKISADIQERVTTAIHNAFAAPRQLSWGAEKFRGDLNSAFNRAFDNKERRVGYDRAELIRQVHSDIASAMSGSHTIRVSGVAGVAGVEGAGGGVNPAMIAAMQRTVLQTLMPAVEELSKAATLVASTARAAGIKGSGTITAKESISTKGADGFTRSYSRKLDNPGTVLGGIQEAEAEKFTAKAEAANLKMLQDSSNKTLSARQRLAKLEAAQMEQQYDALQAASIQMQAGRIALAGEAVRRAQATEAGKERQAVLTRAQDLSQRAAQARFDQRGWEYGPSRRTLDAGSAAGRSAQSAFDKQGWNYGPTRGTMDAGNAAERANAEAMDAKNMAGQRAADVLKHKAALDALKPSVDGNAGAHRVLAGAMNEAHSAARGLAGSMGAMWATYGSIVPLVAAAALGAALRQVVTVGKDVEFQLAFVSALSDNASVSMSKFGDALRGSMVGPVEAAQAMRGLAQNGLSVGESLRALPSILSLATVGEMSLSEAALGATGVMAAFGLSVNDLGRVGDVFAKAAAISNTSVQGMVESMKQASQVGDEFHVTLEQTAAALATLAQRNIVGTAAGTAFRNMMTELAAPSKKARDAMKQVELSVYDANKQILPFGETLSKLRDKVILLDEKSRINFLGDMFGERGAKAVNALINDFDTFKQKLAEITDGSKDFTKSITDALGETTEGKLKKLASEVKVSFVSAFDEASSSAGGLVNSFRLLVASDEFKSGLKSLVDGVVSLTRAFADNWDGIKLLVGGYIALKAVQTASSIFDAITLALKGTTVAALALEAATVGMVGILTGGLAIVVGIAAYYLLLKDNTTEATRAQIAYSDAVKLANIDGEAAIKRMKEENEVLGRQIDLEWSGVDAIKARAQAEGEVKKKAVLNLADDLANNKRLLAEGQSKAFNLSHDDGQERMIPRAGFASQVKENEAIAASIEQGTKALDIATERERQANERDRKVKTEAAAHKALDFNKDLADKKKLKSSITTQPIDLEKAKGQSAEDVLDEIAKRTAEMNKTQLNSYTSKTNSGDARSEEKAIIRDRIQGIHDEEAALQQRLKFQKDLDAAKFPATQFGQLIGAYLAEQRAIDGTTQEITLQIAAREKLEGLKNLPHLKKADIEGIDTEIKREQAKIDRQKESLQNQKDIAAANSAARAINEKNADIKVRGGLAVGDNHDIEKLRASYSTKIVSGGDAASETAALTVRARYAGEIEKYSEKIAESEASIAIERARSTGLSGEDLARENGIIGVLQENLALQSSRLTILKAQESSAAKLAGSVAKSEHDKSQTAEYGWAKFWKDYTESATSSAKIVESVMKKTTDSLADGLAQFVSTGKADWASLARGILSEMTKLWANRAIAKLFDSGPGGLLSLLGGLTGGGSGSTASTIVDSGIAGNDIALAFANGGVMTPYGSLPLRKYAGGGIAHSPQVSVHGEGSLPEANVPLADGRSIPVTLNGGGATSRPSVNVTYAPTIHVDSRTDQAQITHLVNASVAQGNKQLMQHLRDTGALA